MSPAFRGRSIGRADGLDRTIRGHFTKKPFKFSEINPRSRGPLRIFFKKHLRLFRNQPRIPPPSPVCNPIVQTPTAPQPPLSRSPIACAAVSPALDSPAASVAIREQDAGKRCSLH